MSAMNAATKVAFICLPGLQSFLSDIVAWSQERFDTRTCFSDNPQEIVATVAWADVVWLEWANALAVGITKNTALIRGKRIICRLHSYEAFEETITAIDWSRIDDLICVAPHILDIAKARVPDLEKRCKHISIIPNGIAVDRFVFNDRQKGFNLAYVGYINYKKGPMLLLQLLKELVRIDPRYHLSIAGRIQDLRYELYFHQMIDALGLTANVSMNGWIDDIGPWLADKDYILCTSLLESQGLGVMEAMASGVKPVVHNFVGAGEIYPRHYIWNSIAEGRNRVMESDYDSSSYRDWIKQKYSLKRQLEKIEALFQGGRIDDGQMALVSDSPVTAINPQEALGKAAGAETSRQEIVPRQVEHSLKKCVRPGMQVLDIACGNGIVAHLLEAIGATVTNVNICEGKGPGTQGNAGTDHEAYERFLPQRMDLETGFDLVTVIGTLNRIPEEALSGFARSIRGYLAAKGVVYLHVCDGRYIQNRQVSCTAGDDLQLTAHRPDAILSAFAGCGLQIYHLNLYGDSNPLEYNEYLFTTDAAFEQTFKAPD